jgi:hypothetical protein
LSMHLEPSPLIPRNDGCCFSSTVYLLVL